MAAGLRDLAGGDETAAGLLVSLAAARRRAAGLEVPDAESEPKLACIACSQRKTRPRPTAATTPSSARWSASPAPSSIRPPADEARIRLLARELGRGAREETTLYLTGGATACSKGGAPRRSTLTCGSNRPSTLDVGHGWSSGPPPLQLAADPLGAEPLLG